MQRERVTTLRPPLAHDTVASDTKAYLAERMKPRMNRVLRRAALGAAGLVFLVIVYATLVPISLRPDSGHLHAERELAYAALSTFLVIAYPTRWRSITLAICAIAFALEFWQIFIPTRDGRLLDALEKSAGGLAGVMVGLIVTLLVERITGDHRQG